MGVRASLGAAGVPARGLRLAAASRSACGAPLRDVLPAPASPQNPPSAKSGTLEPRMEGIDASGDPLPAGAPSGSANGYRDGGSTNQAILSPDGKVCATASEAGIMLFELATGRRTLWIADSGVPNGAGAEQLQVRVRAGRQEAIHRLRPRHDASSAVRARSPPTSCHRQEARQLQPVPGTSTQPSPATGVHPPLVPSGLEAPRRRSR